MSNGYNNNGAQRPGMGSGGAEQAARDIEDAATRRRRRTAAAMAAAREARGGKVYRPGQGRKMAQRLREKAQ